MIRHDPAKTRAILADMVATQLAPVIDRQIAEAVRRMTVPLSPRGRDDHINDACKEVADAVDAYDAASGGPDEAPARRKLDAATRRLKAVMDLWKRP